MVRLNQAPPVAGQGFADALSGGPLAYASAFPLVLTPTSTLSPRAAAAINELDIEQVVILGGSAAVSPAVEAQVEALGVDVRRIAGTDRTATAVAVAEVAVDELGTAAGDYFADKADTLTSIHVFGGPDLDIGVGFRTVGDVLALLDDLVQVAAFDRLDVAVIDGADPVLRARALSGLGLYEDIDGRFATEQMAALAEERDTEWLRRLDLETLIR